MRLDRGKRFSSQRVLSQKTYEAIVPPGRTIAPWASAPAVEGARSPNPTMASEAPCTNFDPGSPEGGRPARRDSEPAKFRTDP